MNQDNLPIELPMFTEITDTIRQIKGYSKGLNGRAFMLHFGLSTISMHLNESTGWLMYSNAYLTLLNSKCHIEKFIDEDLSAAGMAKHMIEWLHYTQFRNQCYFAETPDAKLIKALAHADEAYYQQFEPTVG